MYTDNILACYMQSLNSEVSHGKTWYADAKAAAQDMADNHELPLHIVVGVIAALSPTNNWSRNLVDADNMLDTFTSGGYVESCKPCTYKKMRDKAWSILQSMPHDNDDVALDEFNPANTAIVDTRFSEQIIDGLDNSLANISLIEYKPNYLKYKTKSSKNGIAIFSEIYYDKGWDAYIDGVLKPHFRANYVLRGMQIPEGNHIVEFKFVPAVYYVSEQIALASSILLLLLFAFVSVKELKYI